MCEIEDRLLQRLRNYVTSDFVQTNFMYLVKKNSKIEKFDPSSLKNHMDIHTW